MSGNKGEGEVLRRGEGENVAFAQLTNRYVVEGSHSEERFAVIEHALPPGALGAPRHTHAHEDEFSYVLEGTLGVEIGDQEIEASAGDTVFKPRGIPHAFWNAGEGPVRLLEIISPARFAGYFRDMAPVFADPAGMAQVRARYELEMDLDSVPELVGRHGLEVPLPGRPAPGTGESAAG
jgi:quercetin dioxygenase-like cupin family protein